MFLDSIIKVILEVTLFLIITIFIFNELTTLLKLLNLFTDRSIKHIGMISVLLATDNLLSKKFLNFQLIP